VVEQLSFLGSIERLRLRLPPLPGARAIAPPAPFGSDFVLVDASRAQHQTRRLPLAAGATAWVGVRRLHALVHPGLSLLLPTDGSPHARAAVALAGQIARLAHARVTVLGHDGDRREGRERGAPAGDPSKDEIEQTVQEAKERLGSGLAALETRAVDGPAAEAVAAEAARRGHDLVVLGLPPRDGLEVASRLLQAGDHHLLLVPGEAAGERPTPARVLICVAVGEPGKEDVLFAARLVRHLGAEATVLKVLPPDAADDPRELAQVERFLAAGARSLARLGVPAETRIRRGPVQAEILAEMAEGSYGLLVLGAPLADGRGRVPLHGLVGRLVDGASHPVLIVRSRREAA
jgi:sulfate/thiosulfate transport system ATP-binding protein